jgi:hypothetical protein
MKTRDTTAEDRLVSFCIGSDFSEAMATEIKTLLSNDLNWDLVLRKSQLEGVSLLVYRRFKDQPWAELIPRYILESWQKEYYANAARNTLILGETKKILDGFQQNKIEAIVLKGVFLAEKIYKNIALRPMNDIDVLIKKEDLERANTVLNSWGYISPPNYIDHLGKDPGSSSINSLSYNKDQAAGFFVHLHWHLVNSTWPLEPVAAKLDMARVWQYAEPVQVAGSKALALSAEHQLLYLALHSFNHSFERLIWLSDILEFLRCSQERIDWAVVLAEAERFKVSYVVYYSLFVVSKRLSCDLPELPRLKPVKVNWLEKIVTFRLAKRSSYPLATYGIYFSRQEGWRGKIKFISGTFFPAAQVMANNLNLPRSAIKAWHYYRRIRNNIIPVLSKKHY